LPRRGTIYLESCVGSQENGVGGAAEFNKKEIKVPGFQSEGAMNASDDNLYRHIAEVRMPLFQRQINRSANLVAFIKSF